MIMNSMNARIIILIINFLYLNAKFLENDKLKTDAPSWPNSFKSLLAKVDEESNKIRWVQHYYDWNKKGERFDFYNNYLEYPSGDWSVKCQILFNGNNLWHVFPDKKQCYLQQRNFPPVNPKFIDNLSPRFSKYTTFRGIEAELWILTETDENGVKHESNYYARADNNSIPLRNPNTFIDPGAADLFDVELGDQPQELFNLPEYCKETEFKDFCG